MHNLSVLSHELKREEVVYMADGMPSKGYIVYDDAIKGKRAAVLVVPEWWGCNAYTRMVP
jgi:dienelactone hydrolase